MATDKRRDYRIGVKGKYERLWVRAYADGSASIRDDVGESVDVAARDVPVLAALLGQIAKDTVQSAIVEVESSA